MRYVRTKDGIYEVKDDFIILKEQELYLPHFQDHVINQADTIKELCDEFVVAYEDGARIVYGDLEWAKTKAKASLEVGNKSIIYGAIWTDKGLIYVAKMNDKGEPKLL